MTRYGYFLSSEEREPGELIPQAKLAEERLEMLEEAVHVIRELLGGHLVTHRGEHYTVDTARLYSTPEVPRPFTCPGSGRRRSSWRHGWPTVTGACSRTRTSSGSTGNPAAGTGRPRAA